MKRVLWDSPATQGRCGGNLCCETRTVAARQRDGEGNQMNTGLRGWCAGESLTMTFVRLVIGWLGWFFPSWVWMYFG
jgi:hypothetical protein